VRHDLGQNKTMCRCDLFGLQGLKDVFATGAQSIAGQTQHVGRAFARDQRFDHIARRLAMQVRHHDTQTYPGISEQFVQPVLLAGQHATELLPVPGNVAQATQVCLGDEGGAQQARACQRGQPLRIGHIGLATRHRLDMAGVDHPSDDAHAFECSVRTLPVNAGALHDYDIWANAACPIGQGFAVSLEAAKFAALIRLAAIWLLSDSASGDLRLVYIQTDDALVDGNNVHRFPPVDV
jgi:hypothetical protein